MKCAGYRGLAPWDEVAREFTARTGLPMNPECARQHHASALRKLRGALLNLLEAERLEAAARYNSPCPCRPHSLARTTGRPSRTSPVA